MSIYLREKHFIVEYTASTRWNGMLKIQHHARYFFFLFAGMGVVSPYLGWWLNEVSSPQHASIVLSCFYATLIITPSLWGHAAFSGNKPGHWLSYATLLTALFALGLSQIGNSSLIAGCFLMISFGLFYNPLVSLVDAIAYAHTEDTHTYSQVRMFGSLGFLIFSSTVGGMVVLSYPHIFPFVVAVIMTLAWIASWPYRTPLVFGDPVGKKPLEALRHALGLMWQLKGLWLIAVLSQMVFVVYYVFFAMHLKSIGFGNVTIGLLVGLATLAEILAFWKIRWFFAKYTPWMLIALASLASAGRWGVVGAVDHTLIWLIALALVQCLHALGFAVFHTACLKLIHLHVPPHDMGVAQGLYNALGYGVGGVIGVMIGSVLWLQGGQSVFVFSVIVSLLMAGLAFLNHHQHKEKPPSRPFMHSPESQHE